MISIDEYLKKVDEVIANGKYKDTWESLSQYRIPDWYKNNRFGLFVHWGCYSVPAVESEWFPRQMYQKDTKSWEWRIKNLGENGDYRQIVERFHPDKFNADEWADIFYKSGAKHIMPVSEHHDGIKMYKSELNRWNTVELTGHDYQKELHDAFDKKGLKFFCSSHRAEHLWFLNGAVENVPGSEAHGEKYRDLYGPCMSFEPSKSRPGHEDGIEAPEYWLKDWLASSCEMVENNKPWGIYFDWWIYQSEFKPYIRKFLAYFYNRCDDWGYTPVVFYKNGCMMQGCAVFDVERGQINSIAKDVWQCDTAIAKNSWGYTENNEFKTPYACAVNLIDVVSKNGCFMLNVGPKADGTICGEEKNVLLKLGEWLNVNGEAIYSCEPFTVFGEGKKQQNKAFNDNLEYSDRDYRFTYKPETIYAFPMSVKERTSYCIKSLRYSNEGIRYDIKNIELLGHPDVKIKWIHDNKSLKIKLSSPVKTDMPLCFKISID